MSFVAMPLLQACGSILFFTQAFSLHVKRGPTTLSTIDNTA